MSVMDIVCSGGGGNLLVYTLITDSVGLIVRRVMEIHRRKEKKITH